jgi:hypothetical protein
MDQHPAQVLQGAGEAGIPATSTGGTTWGRTASRSRWSICAPPIGRSAGWAKFDYVKMPDYRWGILLAPQEEPHHPVRRALGRAGLAGSARRISRHAAPPDRDPGRHRAGLGRAAAPSRQDRALALRPAQPVPGQCRGRPPSLGDGLSAAEIFRPRRPRGSRGIAAPPLRRCRHAAHAGRLQRATPDWLSFFMFTYFTDRDGKMQLRGAGAIRLRSAVAHLPLHADRGSPSHVRRRDRRQPRGPAHLRGDEGGRHQRSRRHRRGARARRDRSADHPEEAQPALLAVARPVRLGSLDQRRQRLQCRHQGPLPRDPDRGRSPAAERRPIRCSSWSTARSSASTSRR